VIESAKRKAYFAGDTGYSPSFPEIGQRFGGPADAIRAHLDVESRFSIACHWGTFGLTDEPLSEPPRLLFEELLLQGIDPDKFRALQPGESVEV
jgi:N-acyl-phosphatidylethanolamine-hydrolysing phospholipase D